MPSMTLEPPFRARLERSAMELGLGFHTSALCGSVSAVHGSRAILHLQDESIASATMCMNVRCLDLENMLGVAEIQKGTAFRVTLAEKGIAIDPIRI